MSIKPTNPKDRAAVSKLDLSLFPATAVAYGALAMVEGDAKYGGYNYRESGVKASVYRAAVQRHLDKWFNGEECDAVSKVPHLANALSCIAVLIDAIECNKLNDDRPPVCDVSGLLARFESTVKHLHTLYPDGPDRLTQRDTAIPTDEHATAPIPVLGVPLWRSNVYWCDECVHQHVPWDSNPCNVCQLDKVYRVNFERGV